MELSQIGSGRCTEPINDWDGVHWSSRLQGMGVSSCRVGATASNRTRVVRSGHSRLCGVSASARAKAQRTQINSDHSNSVLLLSICLPFQYIILRSRKPIPTP
jgi:hypothetical protein